MLLSLSLGAAALAFGACSHDPPVHHPKPGEYPPLPPASGTPVGYIVDAANDLKLRDDQLTKLKDLDSRLAAQDDLVDGQLRLVEKPEEPEEGKRAQHAPQQRGRRGGHQHVASGGGDHGDHGKPSEEANKLHELQDENDRAALTEAFGILDDAQRVAVRKLLLDNGVEPPDEQHPTARKPAAGSDEATQLGGGAKLPNIPGSDVPGEP